jgi:acyl-CoA synthetase (AMP-forming)/AMP-acid ligase II
MITHHNVISNVLQIKTFESPVRDARPPEEKTEVVLGLLPLSHIYGLVVIASATCYRGDEVIVLPKFELQSFLNAIQTRKISTLYLVSYLFLISRVDFTNFLSGSADHHRNGKKLPGMLKIRSQ